MVTYDPNTTMKTLTSLAATHRKHTHKTILAANSLHDYEISALHSENACFDIRILLGDYSDNDSMNYRLRSGFGFSAELILAVHFCVCV
jgi:glycine cleavage system pyridoxal-binding protein P